MWVCVLMHRTKAFWLVASMVITGCSGGGDGAQRPLPSADAGSAGSAGSVPGTSICDEALPIFSTGNKYTIESTDELSQKVNTLTTDNVWVVDTTHCRTYFKVNKYVLRVESLYDESGQFPNQVEAATIVGRRESSNGPWTYNVGARTRTLAIVGTSTDQFRMGGFPYGISLGALVVGSTQTYGGALSDAELASTHTDDAKRAKALWDRFHPGAHWAPDINVVGHSAGSVPAEDVVTINSGVAYLYGTPKYTDLSAQKTGESQAGPPYTLNIFNHTGDPVSGSYQCSAAYYSCKQLFGRTDAKDPDAASVACAVAKDPYCVVVLQKLSDSSAWANHNYSDMSITDKG
jgi:hypothetical protein